MMPDLDELPMEEYSADAVQKTSSSRKRRCENLDDDDDGSSKKRRCANLDDEDDDDGYNWVGTTTAAFLCEGPNGFVILGSDKERGYPSGRVKDEIQKTSRLKDLPIAYTRAGTATHANILIKELEKSVENGVTDITLMPEIILDTVHPKLPANHGGIITIGGYSGEVPHLYCINKDGILDLTAPGNIVELKNRFQTGSGRGAAFIKLNEGYRPNMSKGAAKVLMEDCIYNGIKNDKYTGQGVEYIIISPGGGEDSVDEQRWSLEQFRDHRAQDGPPLLF